jgi:hypothetical protein
MGGLRAENADREGRELPDRYEHPLVNYLIVNITVRQELRPPCYEPDS